ncbi:hypothetical protein F2P56_030298 [Juglans regia]|uniref:protein-disulfide reductase n=1 Tax=Juglans regia TaxID=51240 RepID=A0A833TPB9_JUGRE|nr:hypothetical protein F2P56_030298 [Juglans regia]
MADAEASVTETTNGGPHDFRSLLSGEDRDFLVRNNGDQVRIDSLEGKKLGLYFSASWCGPCRRFTPSFVEVYNELSPKGKRDHLDGLFKVQGIPHLVIIDEDGKVVSDNGVESIQEYGVEGYPFTQEKIKELKDQEEAARKNQSLRSILVSRSRDFIISSDGRKVPVSELEGKIVALYFSLFSYKPCGDFTPKLVEVYEKLKAKGESFEVVMIPLDDNEESFNQGFESMPWFSLPMKDKSCGKLVRYFELSTLPTLVIIGPDGRTLHSNVAETIEEHGVLAYPFTPEKFAELAEIEKAKEEAQTLESILVLGERDFVIGKDGVKIPVSDLVGKNILLYFSAHWCPPCRAFLPKLTEAYHKIKANDDAFEVIFISSDKDDASFSDFFSGMPWLALPFGDPRKASLSRMFKVYGIPMVIAIGPSGRTVTKDARDLIMMHGADAYPFTDERVKEIEDDEVKGPKDDDSKGEENHKEGWVCDGDVCKKA